jgi:hypothetical protein
MLLCKELQGVVGLGRHPVTKQAARVEHAVANMTPLFLHKLRAQDMPADSPWSAFRLQRLFAWEAVQTV